MWLVFCLFLTNSFYLFADNCLAWDMINGIIEFSYAKAFDLDKPKILSSGKELIGEDTDKRFPHNESAVPAKSELKSDWGWLMLSEGITIETCL